MNVFEMVLFVLNLVAFVGITSWLAASYAWPWAVLGGAAGVLMLVCFEQMVRLRLQRRRDQPDPPSSSIDSPR